ncbi:MAG: translation initiation factor IF-2 [Coriobacteriales bacterium]|jgi:translation initiation factor IF-2|nr:translation initiation factor IF-2 [Coriobacteriales bacterium]
MPDQIKQEHKSAILAELARRKAEKAAAAEEGSAAAPAAPSGDLAHHGLVAELKQDATAPAAAAKTATSPASVVEPAPAKAPAAPVASAEPAKAKPAKKSKIKLTVVAKPEAKPAKTAAAKAKAAASAPKAKTKAKVKPTAARAVPAAKAPGQAPTNKAAAAAEPVPAKAPAVAASPKGATKQAVATRVEMKSEPAAKSTQVKPKHHGIDKSKFSKLIEQIEAQKKKMEAAGITPESAASKKKYNHSHGGGSKKSAKQRFSEQIEGDDRYKQMAEAVEKLQKEKVLAEAKAQLARAGADVTGKRKERKEKRRAQKKKELQQRAIEKGIDPSLVLDRSVVKIISGSTVQEVADALEISSSEIVKRLFLLGNPLTATQTMSDDLIELISDDLGCKVRIASPEEEFEEVIDDKPEDLQSRPPVVTVMGHVDHGKTSLLDAIRHTGVVETEAGGITQHIGASVVTLGDRQITFIDTPGHEAFTAMRARGAKVTDVVILVVAADDGVMPQTVEAINHANAAKVPIIVAVNKIDKPGANPEKVRKELSEYNVIPEEWGGQNMFVDISAKQRIGIDDLLERILLQADVLELTANPDTMASGFVIEAKLDKGRGPLATVLVQRGTLKVGDNIVIGSTYGHVRAMLGPRHDNVDAAKPSDPVEILGLNSVPEAGDNFRVFEKESDAKALAEQRSLRERMMAHARSKVSLENLFERIEQEDLSELDLVVKADVQGSIEALQDALAKMDQSEVKINVIHSAVGGITETDVTLASASDAIIIGFNVRPDAKAKAAAEHEQVEIKTYKVIYEAIDDINNARIGMLKPEDVAVDTASLTVKELFKAPKVGTIAGCMVDSGDIQRSDKVRIVRNGAVVHDGEIASLHHFKDEVESVHAGSECGLTVAGFQDIHVGDVLESYHIEQVARTE